MEEVAEALLLALLLIVAFGATLYFIYYIILDVPLSQDNIEPEITDDKGEIIETETKGKLETILFDLKDNTNLYEGDCLSYALYYKTYLNENYPKLDVRKIDMAGVCPIGTVECGAMEGMPHTYLIVNGLSSECILDQKELVCIQLNLR